MTDEDRPETVPRTLDAGSRRDRLDAVNEEERQVRNAALLSDRGWNRGSKTRPSNEGGFFVFIKLD
ncbi:MAG: hypothetical protein HPY50_21825 [Firmicutes bacterium]|nr:hypothetical protein [Bacillota bacterium]